MDLNKFFFTERNLDRVIRFSNQMRIKDESVAAHSFHTAMYSMILADLEIAAGNKVNVEKLLRSALIHDLEESMTGDILHGFKYSDPELLKNMRKMGAEFYEKIVEDLPDNISGKYMDLWRDAKSEGIEGEIMEAADKIEALVYSIEEYSLGNKNFKPIINYLMDGLVKVELGSVRYVLKNLDVPK